MNLNELTSAICDMEDIKETIKNRGLWDNIENGEIEALWDCPKDNDGTEFTIGECVEDVLDFLKETEKEMNNE